MNSSTTPVTLHRCAKTFEDGTRALDPVDLIVQGGETVVLLGPSGCGKTTLLRIVAGLESPDKSGEVWFNNDDVTELPIEKRNVGMVFQSYALFPNMTVAENVAYGLRVRKMAKTEIKVRVFEMLNMMHITELADRSIDQLSGGQRQRVALARAIAVRPRVLLLDEPLTALDALLRERLRVEIDSLLRSLAITSIYVTHDQAEAMALGDRIVVMSKGKIVQTGSPREIYNNPINSFVADFIGTVNRIPSAMIDGMDNFNGNDLVFRPEDAEIVERSAGQFKGKVVNSFFLGDRIRLVVDCGAPEYITVESFQQDLTEKGDEISIRVHQDRFLEIN
jgi:putative spermidine/putrescine transport system ATP-binding protein